MVSYFLCYSVDSNSLVVDHLVRHRQHVDDVIYVTEQCDLSSL